MEQADLDPELTLPSNAKIARWFRAGRALSRITARDSDSSEQHPHVAVHVEVALRAGLCTVSAARMRAQLATRPNMLCHWLKADVERGSFKRQAHEAHRWQQKCFQTVSRPPSLDNSQSPYRHRGTPADSNLSMLS